MGLFGNLFSRDKELKDIQVDSTIPLTYSLDQALYPEQTSLNFAKEGYGKNEIVHACVRELATSAANPRYLIEVPSADGGVIELGSGTLTELIKEPNPQQDWFDWIETLVTHLMVAGNAYVYKERTGINTISALHILRPDRMEINGGTEGAKNYTYSLGGKEYLLEKEDVGHIKLPNPSEDLYGLSPLKVLTKAVNLDLNMTDYAKVFFQNAGVPSGLLKIKRRLQSQDEASVIRSRWRSQFGGTNNFHRVAIMDDDAEYQPMGGVPKDLAMHELHNLSEARICAVYGIPPILIGSTFGLERSTYSNYRQARLSFNSETLQPLVNRILRFLNRNIAVEYPNEGLFAVDKTSLMDMLNDEETETTKATTLFEKGMVTLNEAREMAGLSALPTGDIRRVSMDEMPEDGIEPILMSDSLPSSSKNESSTAVLPYHEKRLPRIMRGGVALRRQMALEREEIIDGLTPELQKYFKSILNKIDGVLGRLEERSQGTEEAKRLPVAVGELLDEGGVDGLNGILLRTTMAVARSTYNLIAASAITGALPWENYEKRVAKKMQNVASKQANAIHNTNKNIIQRTLDKARKKGYSVNQLLRGEPNDNFKGMRAEFGNVDARSKLIARTETMRSQNDATLGYYKETGNEFVVATDVDGDANDNYVDPADPYGRTCIERNGEVYRLSDAQDITDHPNGTLFWTPLAESEIDQRSEELENEDTEEL